MLHKQYKLCNSSYLLIMTAWPIAYKCGMHYSIMYVLSRSKWVKSTQKQCVHVSFATSCVHNIALEQLSFYLIACGRIKPYNGYTSVLHHIMNHISWLQNHSACSQFTCTCNGYDLQTSFKQPGTDL